MIDVYLACPYSSLYLGLKTQRTLAADKAAAKLIRAGFIVYSPISHSHGIAISGGLPGDWEFWKDHDEEFIVFARVIVVLTIGGHDTSEGVNAEIKIAETIDHPVFYWNGKADDEKFFKTLRHTIDECKKSELEEFESQLNEFDARLAELEENDE